jgi:hypothetical protein
MWRRRILAENGKSAGEGSEKQGGNDRTNRVAALRERRDAKRGGNAAPWKEWKTQKTSSPLFPPGLEIRPKTKTPDFHISTAPTTGSYHSERMKNEAKIKFQLTDPDHFKHHNRASVASLPS